VQYVQGVPGLAELVATGVVLRAVPNWVAADRDTPALRADLATLGWERWTGGGWDLTANAYVRRAAGVLSPDVRPGAVGGRPLAVAGRERAGGVELGVRRLAGPWTGSASYALARATTEAGGLRYASAADQRHVLHATAMRRVGRAVRFGAAYSGYSGAPFTRRVAVQGLTGAAGPADRGALRLEAPNAGRLPAFARVDASAEWSFAVRGVRAGAYLQVLNVLQRRNVLAYDGPADPARCPSAGGAVAGACPAADAFVSGIPAVPLAGLRASF
jgi:hypothetical protein